MEVELLDCTLRDGGYINDWKFDNSVIHYMINRFVKSGVDILEVGFLDERREFDVNRTIYPNTDALNKVIGNVEKKNTKFFAMIDYGTCDSNNLTDKSQTVIDGIRIIFKKNNMYNAINFAKELKSKGYLVTLQLVSITSYSDEEIEEFCTVANSVDLYGIGIVDTYGLMHREQMQHYFELLDQNLKHDIAIGYHSHNNFQLAYSNTIEMLHICENRHVILDGTAYGMGKSAGNSPIELIAMFLNENYARNYDMNHILEIIDSCILPIYKITPWGYSLPFFLAASNNCHPNYISYLMKRATLSVETMNEIVKKISHDKLLNYDEEHIAELYQDYQGEWYDDMSAIESIKNIINNNQVVLLAPGGSVSEGKEKTQIVKKRESTKVISVNFIPRDITVDIVFVGNSRRYSIIIDEFEKMENKPILVVTSNVTSVNSEADYIISAETLFDKRPHISDNSAAMLLNLLKMICIKSVVLIGFDGYRFDGKRDNYCVDSFSYSNNEERLRNVNEQMADKITEMRECMDITFATESVYGE